MQLTTVVVWSAVLFGVALPQDEPFARSANIGRRHGNVRTPHLPIEAAPVVKRSDPAKFRYHNYQTDRFLVKSMPDVDFDLGELYSGSIPVDEKDPKRNLFFFFQPTIGKQVDEVTIWLNGGPGCSSLEGFFQENGRWVWPTGTFRPFENPYSWVNLTNMLWVEQPVGTGFSQGPKTATTQEEIAQDFVKWFKNFQKTFGIKNYKIYVTGESYAGRYVPYISAAMVDQKDKQYYNLKGALVYDPSVAADYITEQVPAVPLVNANANLFAFNATFMQQINARDKSCGYEAYRNKYLKFPPPGPQPVPAKHPDPACDIFDDIIAAAVTKNPCFDIYEINSQCPLLWDVLSFPTQIVYIPEGSKTYFDRADVKQAIHAPMDVKWEICTGGVLNKDTSAPSIEHAIPKVIEATNRVLISHGDLDMVLITNGTLMAIQNMTWNGKQGFQQQPSTPINIELPDLQYQAVYDDPANGANGQDGPQGLMGIQHFERGLMWAQTYLAGHMQPEYQPRSSYRHLQWLLGRINHL